MLRELSVVNEISRSEVRLRILDLDEAGADGPLAGRLLSDDERRRAARMRFERDRSRFIVVRTALRETLGNFLSIAPQDVVFRYGPQGKPAVDDRGGVEFNVSHSQGIGIIAVARGHRVGVDVECVSSRAAAEDGLAEYLLTGRELDALRALPPDRQDDAFMVWWTRKEAYVKALGLGLSLPLASFCVSFLPGAFAQLFDGGGRERIEGWSLLAFEPKPGYVAALVVEGEGWNLESEAASFFPARVGFQNADVSNPPQASPAGLK